MRFQVPQFIEHEPKVVGPLTFRQFIFIGIPAAIGFFLYFLAPAFVFVIVTTIAGGIGMALAFIKIEGRPILVILLGAIGFFISPKKYIWQKGMKSRAATSQNTYGQSTSEAAPPKVKLVQKSKVGALSYKV